VSESKVDTPDYLACRVQELRLYLGYVERELALKSQRNLSFNGVVPQSSNVGFYLLNSVTFLLVPRLCVGLSLDDYTCR
jgi:hypothetical protein